MFNKFNKKASVGAGITWIVATFLIVFILVIFVVYVALSQGKAEFESIPKPSEFNLISSEMILAYLNSEIDNVKVKEFIKEEKYEELEKYSENYFNEKKYGYSIKISKVEGKVEREIPSKSIDEELYCDFERAKLEVYLINLKDEKIKVEVQACKEGYWDRREISKLADMG